MSPVTFIKRECKKHPRCYTLTDKCDLCHREELRERIAAIFAETRTRIQEAANE